MESMHAPEELLVWFARHRRDLPWRTPAGTLRDPWQTLVSEVMSQQTRLDVVVPRFRLWMERWPSPDALAAASEEAILAAWAGLGYYSRARNLRKTAEAIARSGWPRDAASLRALPGVGDYTAAAVASLAFGERVAMIDGNVLRVLSRVFALSGDLHSGRGARELAALAGAWVARGDAGTINEATMETGALACTPRSPRCGDCALAGICQGASLGEPERFPSPRPRAQTVALEARVVVIERNGSVLLRKAGDDELLRGHWTLPEEAMLPRGFAVRPKSVGAIRHAITRHRIVWDVVRAEAARAAPPPGMAWVPEGDLHLRLVSSLPRKALRIAGLRTDG